MADDNILDKKDNNISTNNNAKEKYECELCLDSFNLYDRKPVCLVPCVSIIISIWNYVFNINIDYIFTIGPFIMYKMFW